MNWNTHTKLGEQLYGNSMSVVKNIIDMYPKVCSGIQLKVFPWPKHKLESDDLRCEPNAVSSIYVQKYTVVCMVWCMQKRAIWQTVQFLRWPSEVILLKGL